jgi:hypothetical protein
VVLIFHGVAKVCGPLTAPGSLLWGLWLAKSDDFGPGAICVVSIFQREDRLCVAACSAPGPKLWGLWLAISPVFGPGAPLLRSASQPL